MQLTHKITSLDSDQINRYSFDEEYNAQRVVIVGERQCTPSINEPWYSQKIEYKEIQVPYVVKDVQTIEIPTIIEKEVIKVIEVVKEIPVIVKEIEYKEIIKEIPVEKIVYKEIDRPYIVEKTIEKEVSKIPMWLKVCLISQTAAIIGMLVVKLILK